MDYTNLAGYATLLDYRLHGDNSSREWGMYQGAFAMFSVIHKLNEADIVLVANEMEQKLKTLGAYPGF